MRKLLFTTLILFLASTFNALGQESSPTVKISTDKVKIDGSYYYIHIVRKGETLYSISRAYNVSQMEIAMENPDIYLGLQTDQALKIPIKSQKDDNIEDEGKDDSFIYHVAKRKETLFGLSQKYEISIEDIITANPEVEEGLKVNQVVLIPKEKVETLGDDSPEKSDRFIYHEVQPKEGFYSISKQYDVSEDIIKKFNADLVKDGIKLGTVLKIPRNPNDTIQTPEPLVDDKKAQEMFAHEEDAPAVDCDTFEYNRWRDVYNVAVVLPFTTELIRSSEEVVIDYEPDDEDDDDKNGENSNSKKEDDRVVLTSHTANFLDFYQGLLIALDSLKDQGTSIKLTVYNTGKNAKNAKELTKEEGLQEANLIIGPAYPECLKPIADFALENRIPMVSPLSPNNFLLDKNPYLFQVNPSFSTQLKQFTESINFCEGQNIVLVHEADSTNVGMIDNLKEKISQRFSDCSSPDLIHYKEVTYKAGSSSPDVQERISHSLSLDRENMIIVPSNNEAFVSDLLGNLHTLSTIYKYPVSVYGFPRWKKFRNVQIEYYYQLQLHLFTPFYVDYQNNDVKSFITKYRDAFRSEPTQYSYQGYDVMLYFMTAMRNYGPDFQFCISNHNVELLQSNYRFKKINTLSGFENQSVYMLRYKKDFEITKNACKKDSIPRTRPRTYHNESGSDKKEAVDFD
ncbi:MAG: LysM peptidoglycan-binding domain-containing protein [Bacteroidales bacterium]